MKKHSKTERFIGISLVLSAGLCLFCPDFFLSALVQSLSIQVMGFAFLIGIAGIVLRKYFLAGTGLLSGFMILPILIPFISPDVPEIEPGIPEITMAHFNVLYINNDFDPVVEKALEADPDFLSFQEITAEWQTHLACVLNEKYPYAYGAPREDQFGLSVFSKYPLTEVVQQNWQGVPSITGKIQHPKGAVAFAASHLNAPMVQSWYSSRNAQLRDIASHLSEIPGPKIAIGDYNTVPWAAQIDTFKTSTRMRDSRKGLDATFPSWFPSRIPIDYIFHSSELQCLEFKTLSGHSSDHFGIIGKYKLNFPQQQACLEVSLAPKTLHDN